MEVRERRAQQRHARTGQRALETLGKALGTAVEPYVFGEAAVASEEHFDAEEGGDGEEGDSEEEDDSTGSDGVSARAARRRWEQCKADAKRLEAASKVSAL